MTTTIKKPFQELVELLQTNANKKVSDILPQVIELAESKKQAETVRKDEQGNVTHILCWYHKEWEPVEHFGKKASSHSGYNTMCKQGVNSWTKQRRDKQKAKDELLQKVATNEITIDELNEGLQELETTFDAIIPRSNEA